MRHRPPHWHGPHGHPHHGPPHRFRRRWALVHGIHRRVLSVLAAAVLLGGVAGVAMHRTASHGPGIAVLGVALAALLLIWPLAWVATFRIARPVVQLARVAEALREGELTRRSELKPDRRSDDEVDQLAGALDAMADRIASQLDDQRSLMAAVSHELRSPLGRLRVLAELAREARAPADVYDAIQAEIDGMDALVGDLLAGSRIDFEAIQPRDVAAADAARRALEQAGLSEDRLVLEVHADRVVRADPTLLARALGVLLDNAVRYGGAVEALRVTDEPDTVRFEVHDSGPGFREGEQAQVFEPFWRRPPEPGAPRRDGVGLGLALVARIADAHGGSAGAANRDEGGARVWLQLPRQRSQGA